jgi:3-isopropylmalate dehydrogenase
VRENNEGLYIGAGGFVFKGTPHEVAIQESVNTRRGVERCLKYAFELAKKRAPASRGRASSRRTSRPAKPRN